MNALQIYKRILEIQTKLPLAYAHYTVNIKVIRGSVGIRYDGISSHARLGIAYAISELMQQTRVFDDSDDEAISAMVADLSMFRTTMRPVNFYKCITELEAVGFMFKVGYKGNNYVVNPLHFNIFTSKQAKWVTAQLLVLADIQLPQHLVG